MQQHLFVIAMMDTWVTNVMSVNLATLIPIMAMIQHYLLARVKLPFVTFSSKCLGDNNLNNFMFL